MTKVNLIAEHLEKGNTSVLVHVYNNYIEDRVGDKFYTTVDKAFEVCSEWNSFKWEDGMCQTSAVVNLTDEQICSLR
jgi:hypothetical protein